MSQIFSGDAQALGASIVLAVSSETAALTTNALNVPYGTGKIRLHASVLVTTGPGTTGLQVRIRRGTDTTGALVGTVQTVAAAASALVNISIDSIDVLQDGRSQPYTLTVQQVGAGSNGTIQPGTELEGMVLSG